MRSCLVPGPERSLSAIAFSMLIILFFPTIDGIDIRTTSDDPEERGRSDDLMVSGWTFPWDPSSWNTLKQWGDELDEVSPYWYYALRNGSVEDSHNDTGDRDFIVHCRSMGMDIIPMISNNHDVDVISNIVQNSTAKQNHIDSLLSLILANGFEGIDINYENIPTALKDDYSSFIQDLSAAFHARGKKVYVSVFPKMSDDEDREGPGAYDYREIGKHADLVRVMVYNLHWSSSERAGPITAHDWIDLIMEYSTEAIPIHKVSLGIPLFGYDWIVDRHGNTLSIAENRSHAYIDELLRDPGIDREWNGSSRTPYLEYVESNGKRHSIHYFDAESLLHEMLIIRKYGISSISLWRIGNEDPLVRDYLSRIKYNGIDDLPPYVHIGYDKQGMKGDEMEMGPVRAYDIDGMISSIDWSFGDGGTSNVMDALYSYPGGGSYTASLSVADDGGNMVNRSKKVLIGPYPHFTIEGDMLVDSPIQFNANGSWDLGEIVSYNWNMGDGTYRFHAGTMVDHTYSTPGKREVTLTVINDRGYTDTMTKEVYIPDTVPPEVIAGGDLSIWEDMEIVLDGRGSTDNSGNLRLIWHLHNGSVIETDLITLSFPEPGMYNITLQGIDGSGLSANDTIEIEVKDRTSPMIVIDHPGEVEMGDPFSIDISGSSDNVGIDNITWRLPDGRYVYGRMTIEENRSSAGRYYYSVDILDGMGNWNSTTVYVDVRDNDPPEASVIIDPAPASFNETYLSSLPFEESMGYMKEVDEIFVVNVTYRFLLVNATDRSGISYINWSFGDTGVAHGDSVYHNYSLPGKYQIDLRVTDTFGNEMQRSMIVLVIPTVNHTLIPVQPYEDVYVEQELPEEEKERRVLPIALGITAIIAGLSVVVIVLLAEMASAVDSFRRMGVDER